MDILHKIHCATIIMERILYSLINEFIYFCFYLKFKNIDSICAHIDRSTCDVGAAQINIRTIVHNLIALVTLKTNSYVNNVKMNVSFINYIAKLLIA